MSPKPTRSSAGTRTALWFAAALLPLAATAQTEPATDAPPAPTGIVHDAEHYVLAAQHAERWAAEDEFLDQKLAELRAKHGRPPNIIHIMWDDTAFGDVGIPELQKVRGLNTPNINQMAEDGILFTRMYTEVGCTPSRAASATGRHPVRNGMFNIGMLLESHGIRDEEVTIAEVLSEAGYMTAFHGKWHLGDIEQSYPHNQGFHEAFFTGYNQILSLNTPLAEGANASIGLIEDMLPADPYKLDDSFITKGWVQVAEGVKGGETRQWGDNSHDNYVKIDPEAQRRTLEFIERQAKAGKPFYVANWPNMTSFIPNPKKCSLARSILPAVHRQVSVPEVAERCNGWGVYRLDYVLLICTTDRDAMETINISDLRNRLPEFLSRAEAGEEIEVTRRGAVIARILPPADKRLLAKKRLATLREQASVGDVLSPVTADWEAER